MYYTEFKTSWMQNGTLIDGIVKVLAVNTQGPYS